jgi:hypothetical protein
MRLPSCFQSTFVLFGRAGLSPDTASVNADPETDTGSRFTWIPPSNPISGTSATDWVSSSHNIGGAWSRYVSQDAYSVAVFGLRQVRPPGPNGHFFHAFQDIRHSIFVGKDDHMELLMTVIRIAGIRSFDRVIYMSDIIKGGDKNTNRLIPFRYYKGDIRFMVTGARGMSLFDYLSMDDVDPMTIVHLFAISMKPLAQIEKAVEDSICVPFFNSDYFHFPATLNFGLDELKVSIDYKFNKISDCDWDAIIRETLVSFASVISQDWLHNRYSRFPRVRSLLLKMEVIEALEHVLGDGHETYSEFLKAVENVLLINQQVGPFVRQTSSRTTLNRYAAEEELQMVLEKLQSLSVRMGFEEFQDYRGSINGYRLGRPIYTGLVTVQEISSENGDFHVLSREDSDITDSNLDDIERMSQEHPTLLPQLMISNRAFTLGPIAIFDAPGKSLREVLPPGPLPFDVALMIARRVEGIDRILEKATDYIFPRITLDNLTYPQDNLKPDWRTDQFYFSGFISFSYKINLNRLPLQGHSNAPLRILFELRGYRGYLSRLEYLLSLRKLAELDLFDDPQITRFFNDVTEGKDSRIEALKNYFIQALTNPMEQMPIDSLA